MPLSGSQIQQLQDALINAYDGPMLAQMVRMRMDEDLPVIAGGANLGEVVFNLIIWAERTGRTEELIFGASASNPQNSQLKAFTAQYLGAAAGQPPRAEQDNRRSSDRDSTAREVSHPSQTIDTQGGAYIGGNVSTGGGDFVGRDQIVHGDRERGDKAPRE